MPPRCVEHLRVDDAARRHVHVVGAEPLQEGAGVAALDADLAERGHVEQADAVAHRQMLVALVVEPVLPLPGIAVLALLAGLGEPVGALPAGDLAEHRAARLQMLVQRRAAHAARGRHLAIGEMVGIEQAERLGDALLQIAAVLLERLGAADVDFPQVEGRLAVVDPLRQRHAGAAGRDDADRIVAGRDPVAVEFRRFAEIVAVVGREAFGAVEEGVDAGGLQHRHAVDAHFEDRLEMVEILRQLVEAEILADAVHAPGLGHRLEGAEHHLAGVFLVVGAFVRHAQHRQARQARDRLGDEVEMLAGMQRQGDARTARRGRAPTCRRS